jgi:putative tricarboxylic transport membrane protein
MDILNNLASGFGVALTPINLLYCFLGSFIGTAIGVLPGLGPPATIALLLPVTYGIPATSAVILLAGIFYGAMYGGSTTSILLNIPGEAASVVTCLDGYQMARQGRAGAALAISAFGSFIAATFSIVGLMLLAPPLASFALCPPRSRTYDGRLLGRRVNDQRVPDGVPRPLAGNDRA